MSFSREFEGEGAFGLVKKESPSSIDKAHHPGGITFAGDGVARRNFFDLAQITIGQADVQGPEILLQIFSAFSSENGDDVLSLGQDPSQSQLRRGATFRRCERTSPLDQIEVALEILALETRRIATIVVRRQVFKTLDRSAQEPSPEWAVGD